MIQQSLFEICLVEIEAPVHKNLTYVYSIAFFMGKNAKNKVNTHSWRKVG